MDIKQPTSQAGNNTCGVNPQFVEAEWYLRDILKDTARGLNNEIWERAYGSCPVGHTLEKATI